jgi:hypothetical protein
VFHLYVVRAPQRDAILKHLQAHGIGAGVHYPIPIHHQAAYRHRPLRRRELPNTERFARELLSLPLYPEMTQCDASRVVDRLREALGAAGPHTVVSFPELADRARRAVPAASIPAVDPAPARSNAVPAEVTTQ